MIVKILSCPFIVLLGIAGISAFSLAAALTAEIVFGLEPCILCIYQRIPFAAGLLLSLLGLALCRKKKRGATALIGLSGLGFLINSVIAFYHSGVELKWWRSIFEGCAAPDFSGDTQSIIENILSAPTARRDEIPWADPILGLSMANYNVLLSFGLFIVCTLSVIKQRQAHSEQQTSPAPDRNGK